MKRREFLAGAVSAVCVGAVGASRADEFGSQHARLDSEWPTSKSTTDDQGATTDDGSESAAVEDPTEAAEAAEAPKSTLEVVSTASGETPVRLRVVHARTGAVVHDRVRELAYGERAYLSGVLERGEPYVFTLAVDGATLVQETVSPGERAVFELLDETTVSVVA